MIKHLNATVVLTLTVTAFVSAATDQEPAATDGTVIHTRVERLDAAPRDPALLGVITEEDRERIAARQDRLIEGREHPKPGPPFETVDVSPELLVPRNPSTDPVAVEGAPSSIILHVNSDSGYPAPASWRAEVAEPAVAASGDRVFYTGNWFAATSANGGTDFDLVNPGPGPFPAPTGEVFCCDQTMAHDPGSNTIFWLQQFIPQGGTNTGTQRINIDQGSDGSWDCAYDINTVLVGFNTNTWFDYPDLAVSTSYLYHSSNAYTFSGGWAGAYAGRYPLAELATCSTPLTIDAYTTASWGSFRFSRGADDTMYFAAQPNNSYLRIWDWEDGVASPSANIRSVTAWLNNAKVCPGPDGRNWCGFHDGRLQSGFVSGTTLGFVWTPSQGGGFPFPYVRISTFDIQNDLAQIDDIDIWSSDVAYMYPSASVNAIGELGGTVMWGGGDTHYASCSAWMAESPTVADLVPLDHLTSIAGSYGPRNGDERSGDYTMSARYYPDGLQFAGACFAYTGLNTRTTTYVRFGSEASEEIFADDFSSGDANAWSNEAP